MLPTAEGGILAWMEARQSRKPSEKRERRMQILERTTDKEAPTTFGKNPVSLRLHKIGGGIRPRGGVVELFSRVYRKAWEDGKTSLLLHLKKYELHYLSVLLM